MIQKIKDQVEIAEVEAEKFYAKGNGAAGTRLRAAMQEIKNLAQQIREDVSVKKNAV